MFDRNSWQLEDITFVLNEYVNKCLQWGYKDESVLHFGSGSGFITDKFLRPHLPSSLSLLGVEDDPDLVDFAKKYHQREQVKYRSFKDIQDCVFDHILSFYNFSQHYDEIKLFRTLNKHLTPNGDLLMIFLNEHSILTTLDTLMESGKYEEKLNKATRKMHAMRVSNETLMRIMKNNTFLGISFKCYERYQIFPNKSVLKKFLRCNVLGVSMSEEEFKQLLTDFIDLLMNQCGVKRIGRTRNVLAVPYKMTVVYGKKYNR